jgi:hypothetical protein
LRRTQSLLEKFEKRDFDEEAASWDNNPARVKLADDVVHAILEQIVFAPEMNIRASASSTGLLALRLQPLVHSVTGINSSKGMLDFCSSLLRDNATTCKVIAKDIEIPKVRQIAAGGHPSTPSRVWLYPTLLYLYYSPHHSIISFMLKLGVV